MTEQSFSLIPFPQSTIPAIKINGCVSRQNGQLSIQYVLSGDTSKISLSEKAISPGRRDGLWVTTCFEFFLAVPNDPQYWEINVSPSGDWNIYHMDAYRRVGFREEASISQLPCEVKNGSGRITLDVEMDLSPLVPDDQALQMGIACVIQSSDQRSTYWALVHPTSMPDFHLRETFIIPF